MSEESRRKLIERRLERIPFELAANSHGFSELDRRRLNHILNKLPPEDRQWLLEQIAALQERRRGDD